MPATVVHPTAVISDDAEIAEGVTIGPYAVIGPKVKIGPGCTIGSHTCIDGHTVLGANNKIGRHACVGADPQDMSYKGEETFLVVGDNNFLGDYIQVCRGTLKTPDRLTRIGNNNYLMAYMHVGHDCIIGDSNIMANNVALAGHVTVENNVYIGGIVAIHQFLKIGRFAMVSGGSAASRDVPPYVRVAGYGCDVYGLNIVGITRSRQFTPEQIRVIRSIYRIFFREGGSLAETLVRLRSEFPGDESVEHFCKFVETAKRGVARARSYGKGKASDDE